MRTITDRETVWNWRLINYKLSTEAFHFEQKLLWYSLYSFRNSSCTSLVNYVEGADLDTAEVATSSFGRVRQQWCQVTHTKFDTSSPLQQRPNDKKIKHANSYHLVAGSLLKGGRCIQLYMCHLASLLPDPPMLPWLRTKGSKIAFIIVQGLWIFSIGSFASCYPQKSAY